MQFLKVAIIKMDETWVDKVIYLSGGCRDGGIM